MSLYYEASKFIAPSSKQRGNLKTRIFAEKALKSKPAQIYGLAIEASRYSSVLTEVIEKSGLLTYEKKLTPELALLLVHDLLFARRGIAAPQGHKLRACVEKHKARLNAELTRYRLRHKFATLEELKLSCASDGYLASTQSDAQTSFGNEKLTRLRHPRWVRINRLKTTLDEQLATSFRSYQKVEKLEEILKIGRGSAERYQLHVDRHIPDLLAVPSDVDLSREAAYVEGKIILQDKASCFPAYLINPDSEDRIVIDGCAAPGNKTTHLASLMAELPAMSERRIVSCERDKSRAQILQKMVDKAGADAVTTVKAGQDFLRTNPEKQPWCEATAILLDPSCSGSGIIGRDDAPERIVLPSLPIATTQPNSKKRKHRAEQEQASPEAESALAAEEEEVHEDVSAERLEALGRFQAKLVQHAFKFPNVRKITYSTCSIHEEENEHVVATVLASDIAKASGWRIMRRSEQVEGMKAWDVRGIFGISSLPTLTAEMADACIRCEKHTVHGTQGFFVAGFVRGGNVPSAQANSEVEDDEEWGGFDDL